MPQPTPDLTAQRFGRLVVLARNHEHVSTHAMWYCSCDCGKTVTVAGSSLRSGNTRSCGCLRRETTTARNFKHGNKPRIRTPLTPTYTTWSNMIRRCTKPNHPRYADWGGRGITVCERWRKFDNFLEDMGEKPPGTTLDRRDNDGPYSKENCRWVKPVVQARNKRTTQLTPEAIYRIRDLAAEGHGVLEVAAATGIRRHTVGAVMATIDALNARSIVSATLENTES